MYKVSIIIPVFNAGQHLAATLASAIGQTWRHKEIIVIDDGSTDDSFAVAERQQSDIVRIIKIANSGAGAARNAGLRLATGDYIQFLDADDLISPDKIEAQLAVLAGTTDHVGLCTTVHFQDGEDPGRLPVVHEWVAEGSDDPVDFLIKLYGGALVGPQYGGMIQPNAWLTPAAVIAAAGPWNEQRCPDDDGEFFCRVLLASGGIRYSYKAVNFYRKYRHTATLSSVESFDACRSMLDAIKLKTGHLLARRDVPLVRKALARLFSEHSVTCYPRYRGLSREADRLAAALDPGQMPRPYPRGFNAILASLFGWRMVRYLQFIKRNII